MAFLRRCILLLALSLAAMNLSAWAKSAEERDFEAAMRAFHDHGFSYSESKLDEFIHTYTNSPRLPEALLYEAQSRYQLSNYDGALQLLSANRSLAGKWADQYQFWQAECLFARKDFSNAAAAYQALTRDYPASPRRLEAAVDEAMVYARLNDWPRVLAALQQSNSVFQEAVRTNLINDPVLRGYLLLSEAHLNAGNFPQAEAALQPMGRLVLEPDVKWQRQFLLSRVAIADKRPDDALLQSSNMVTTATEIGRPALMAESVEFQAGVFERLGRFGDALQVYKKNLTDTAPAGRQRKALLKLASLAYATNGVGYAAETLERFAATYTNAAAADLAWLTAGQFRLQQCVPGLGTNLMFESTTNASADPNCLQRAVTDLQTLTAAFPDSPHFGKAQLALGLCYWFGGNLVNGRQAFESAVSHLPPSFEQAVALFDLASVEFLLTNYSAALANYGLLLQKYESVPDAVSNLFEGALYQEVRAALALNDVPTCTNAAARLLAFFPNGFHTDRAVLMAGQGLVRSEPAAARALYLSVAKASTNAALLPELQLAVARTYEQETNWDAAVTTYDQWLEQFKDAPARPRAEYARAWALWQAGRETNALACFTNLLSRFPSTNDLNPLARRWVADYYYTTGDFLKAENEYQQLALDRPGEDLAFQAWMGAGRSALARQSPTDAQGYFRNVYTNATSPDLRAHALYAYADTCLSVADAATTNKLGSYKEAIDAYDGVIRQFPTNALATLALGAKANCLLQCGSYSNALAAYQQVAATSNGCARATAKLGMAIVLEKQADALDGESQVKMLRRALASYLDVFYDDDLKTCSSGLFWVKKAGQEAARLAEALKDWPQASSLYQRLEVYLPQLRDFYEAKKKKAETNIAAQVVGPG